MKNVFVTLFLVMALLVLMSGQLAADTFLKHATHVGAFEMMGQKSPEKNDTMSIWLTTGKSCSQGTDGSHVIYNEETGKIYIIDDEKKEYSIVSLKAEEASEEQSEAMKMMQAMGGSTKVTVTPTDVTEKIGDWDTKKYNVEMTIMMMNSKQDVWATEDINIDFDLYAAVSNGPMAQIPGFDKIMEEMKKVKGLPVKTVTTTNAMGGEVVTTTTLLEQADKEAPAGIYDIPEGYKEVQLQMGMGKR